MPSTYEWLFNSYVCPRTEELKAMGDHTVEALMDRLRLSGDDRLEVWDTLSGLRYRWGMEVFALGLQLGVRLTAPSLSVEEPL